MTDVGGLSSMQAVIPWAGSRGWQLKANLTFLRGLCMVLTPGFFLGFH